MDRSRVAMIALLALAPASMASAHETQGIQPNQKHEFVVELDPKTEIKAGTTDGVRTVEDFTAADKTYVVYEADTADALTKYLAHAGLTPKKVIEVRDMNSPTRGGG